MRIRALVHIAGAGFALAPGDETEIFSDADATRLVAKNAAVLVSASKPIEVAVEAAPAMETRAPVFPVKQRKGKK